MKIDLKCPECGQELAVMSAEGLEDKTTECPKCHRKDQIKNFLPKLALKVGDTAYQLHFGRQWTGRKTEGNDAEVQIVDPTRYMSRKHAAIEVRIRANALECTYEEHGKNPSMIKGVELLEDDIIYLNPNDYLQMGDSKMYLSVEYAK